MTNGEQHRPHDEPEPTFAERVMDRLQGFDDRLRDMEGRTKDLEDDQAALGLLDQLAAMDKRIDRHQDAVLYHMRFLCVETIISLQADFFGWLRVFSPANTAAREYALAATARSMEKAWASDTPTTIVREHRQGLATYCKNHSLQYFLDDS